MLLYPCCQRHIVFVKKVHCLHSFKITATHSSNVWQISVRTTSIKVLFANHNSVQQIFIKGLRFGLCCISISMWLTYPKYQYFLSKWEIYPLFVSRDFHEERLDLRFVLGSVFEREMNCAEVGALLSTIVLPAQINAPEITSQLCHFGSGCCRKKKCWCFTVRTSADDCHKLGTHSFLQTSLLGAGAVLLMWKILAFISLSSILGARWAHCLIQGEISLTACWWQYAIRHLKRLFRSILLSEEIIAL